MEIKWLVFTRRIVETLTGSGLVSHLLVSFLPTLGLGLGGFFFFILLNQGLNFVGILRLYDPKHGHGKYKVSKQAISGCFSYALNRDK